MQFTVVRIAGFSFFHGHGYYADASKLPNESSALSLLGDNPTGCQATLSTRVTDIYRQ